MTDMMTRQVFRAGASAAFALAVSGCSGRTPAPAADAGSPLPVTVTRAEMADIGDTFEAGGVVQARTTAAITARILAPVREVRVAPGDHVKAGQTLIVLDGRDLAAQARSGRAAAQAAEENVTAADSEQQSAEAAVVLARTTRARIADLQSKRSATAQELDDVTGALHAAEARVAGAAARARAARAALDSARAAGDAAATTESFAIVSAPFDGMVTDKTIEPGNMAAPGQPLLRVEDTRGFRLDVRVDESRLGAIAVGTRVPVTLDAGAGSTTTLSGTVAEISRAVDADARAFLVKVALPDGPAMRSGTFGRARFGAGSRRALTIPPAALMQRGQVTSVFVVDNGVARLRLVNVSGSEVLAGLSAGDTVIVGAPPGLTDGRRVTEGGR